MSLNLIGNTPLVKIGNFYAKAEMFEPGGSIKDRAACYMILDAEEKGLLGPGGTVIEPTSGNTGIGLAWIGSLRGYKVILVMPDSMSMERRQLMQAYGAQLVLTPGALGMQGAVNKAKELLAATPGGFIPDQFSNPANARAHYETTGREIWTQTGGKVDIFVAGVGTGGTVTGIGRYLKEQNRDIQIIAVEPAASALLSGAAPGPHKIQGIGANFIPALLDQALLDGVMAISDEDAMDYVKTIRTQTGLLAGISAGANCAAAARLARENPGKTVVTVLPDSGRSYLSTGVFD